MAWITKIIEENGITMDMSYDDSWFNDQVRNHPTCITLGSTTPIDNTSLDEKIHSLIEAGAERCVAVDQMISDRVGKMIDSLSPKPAIN